MPSWWDYLHFNRQYNNKRNLEEGLFQIASQTCNILVKVNNTNNINLTRNNRSDEYGCAGPPEGKSSMQICIPKFRKNSLTAGCNPGLSTVLESGSVGNASSSDEELEQWEQIFMMRDENGNSYNDKRKKKSIWCRPSCIPVSIVIVLIVLVVLVPLLDQPNIAPALPTAPAPLYCSDECRLSLVETIPEGHMYPPNITHTPTKQVWLDLIDEAQSTIEIASFYWTLRFYEEYPYNSSIEGEQVFQALYAAGSKRNIHLKIAQNWPTKLFPNIDTDYLVKKKAAQVRSLNFSKLLGGGVLHTKFWIIDRQHFYIGSANMDWRSLTQVKELGIVAYNCSCLATDLGKIFDVYWSLGDKDAVVPDTWPANLSTNINIENPINITDKYHSVGAYITSSPPPFSPHGRTNDDDAIVSIIESAEEFVHISVMDYAPVMEFTPKLKFWPKIDDAIRRAALEHRVKVKMLISWWQHSAPSEENFLRSLVALAAAYPRVDLQVKRYIVPSTPEQAKIPHARVNHNKYLVTERAAYVGTSNWSGDYFVDTAGVAFVLQEPRASNVTQDIRAQLEDLFERDWNSPYAVPLPLSPLVPLRPRL
ncbi:5'-3' exonuclease PLD3-like isoform X1 [Cydia pomonella]|uniref:5'-3' exonuclease PLD3-like isoform X1 n=2 Tax=Cydia pomonella TaxID=82600 RepID=UPI002ADD69F3|nr:5'-3' exonuclease PLD3-like isoform X1 [Cydia pomonella]